MKPATMGVAALLVLAACDFPTSAPSYTTEWNVPAQNTTIAVNTFLPTGVTATSDNSAFQVAISPSSSTIQRSLGQDCAACAAANGQTVPKPAFTGGGTTSIAFPSGVASATLVRDTLSVSIANSYDFDPIRPSATARGYLVIMVKNGSALVGLDSLDGNAIALPSGSVTTRKIPLTGTVTASSGLQVSTSINSPLGDPVVINTAQSISVVGSTGSFFLSSASVNLANQQVVSASTTINLANVDQSITNHVNGGTLLMTVTNPFGATGNLTATFSGGASTVVKSVALSAGTSTPSITLTGPDMQALLGYRITVSFAGTVSGNNLTVTPGLVVGVATRLQFNVNVGGTN